MFFYWLIYAIIIILFSALLYIQKEMKVKNNTIHFTLVLLMFQAIIIMGASRVNFDSNIYIFSCLSEIAGTFATGILGLSFMLISTSNKERKLSLKICLSIILMFAIFMSAVIIDSIMVQLG